MKRLQTVFLAAALGGMWCSAVWAQQVPAVPTYNAQQLETLVARIALYPDPLLAQTLTAATFYSEIPDADGWARAHAYLSGDQLAGAIREDKLPWDPSVQALLPFPGVLDLMAGDMAWTQQLGDVVLADRASVMDAIQDQRQKAYSYGYLRTGPQYRVLTPAAGEIDILPVDPNLLYVPYYDPFVVFYRPRPGFFIGGAITFGPRIFIGSFLPWGWGGISFGWRAHSIVIGGRPWERTWVNRGVYVHPYEGLRPNLSRPIARPGVPTPVPAPAPRMERHELRQYTPAPRNAAPAAPQRGGSTGGREQHR